jgi:hypothetical protein
MPLERNVRNTQLPAQMSRGPWLLTQRAQRPSTSLYDYTTLVDIHRQHRLNARSGRAAAKDHSVWQSVHICHDLLHAPFFCYPQPRLAAKAVAAAFSSSSSSSRIFMIYVRALSVRKIPFASFLLVVAHGETLLVYSGT